MQLNKVFFEIISPEIEIVFKYLCFEYSLFFTKKSTMQTARLYDLLVLNI